MTAASDQPEAQDAPWWKKAVLYQIYPRSFADSNADGIGDLQGIIDRLDHLEWLGVDGIWLSPITVSPNADWGYDVADYRAVQPDLGTMETFDDLVAGRPRATHTGPPRHRPKPHQRQTSLVREVPLLDRRPHARLVRLGGSKTRWE